LRGRTEPYPESATTRILNARCIVDFSKKIRGEVLFSSSPIAFLQGVDPEKGYVSEANHEIYGKPFSNKILVFPNSVGSSVGAYVIYRLKKNRKAPLAMINQISDIITASGCALSDIPLFDLPSDSFEILADTQELMVDRGGMIKISLRKGSKG
jgi:predicted aconitase with swiveling domain